MRSLVIFAGLMLAVSVGFVRFVDRPAPAQPAPAAAMNATPSNKTNNSRSITVPRGRNGHFQVDGRVDGKRLEFVVDTGASQIALRESEAARLGIRPSARDYTVMVQTANGVTRAAMVRLNRVEIGDVVVHDVQALIHSDSALGVNLLGMSFLSRVKFAHEHGKLVIEQ
jgi:aspartyl protease family protein